MVETEPNAVRNESVVVEGHSLGVIAIYGHGFGFPPVISAPVEVDVADLVRAGSIYVERIRGASLECTSRRIVQPRRINLVGQIKMNAEVRFHSAKIPFWNRKRKQGLQFVGQNFIR